MKTLLLMTPCLIAIAAVNLGLAVHQRMQINQIATQIKSLAARAPEDAAFDQRLAQNEDPVELRRLARTQFMRAKEARRTAMLLTTSFQQLTTATLLRGILLLVVSSAMLAVVLPPFCGRGHERMSLWET